MELSTVGTAWGLLFLLGLRHGLDPDHIAVICSATIRMRKRVNQDENPVCRDWRRA